ncbi:hypothetical protein OBRU01_27005, partial [Operophtera brumata]
MNKYFYFGLLNKGSLGTKHDELVVAIDRFPVDILATNETWLREGEEARAPSVPGYRLRHAPRPHRSAAVAGRARGGGVGFYIKRAGRARGGGVGFYIKRGVSARLLSHPETPGVDQMWLRLCVNGHKLARGVRARLLSHPETPGVDQMWLRLCVNGHKLAVAGDFNIDLINSDSDSKKLRDFPACFKLEQYVKTATHFTDHSETLIDLLCSNLQLVNVIVEHMPDLSKHALLLCRLKIKKEKPIPQYITYRPLKEIDFEKFNFDLAATNWSHLISNDVNRIVEEFQSHVINLFNRHAPLRRCLLKVKSYPWITYHIKEMMKTRDKAYGR